MVSQAILQSKFKAKVSGMESEHAAKTKELETKISKTKTNLESKFKAKVSAIAPITNDTCTIHICYPHKY